MASTNKTTNYELSQFIGADKPAWLQDYNSDMGKIDTGIHNAQTTATGADGKADANSTKIGTLASLTTTDKTSLVSAINEVDSNADTAQNTATNAGTLANTAKLTADSIASQLNLNTIKADNQMTFTTSAGSFNGHDVTVVRNSESSLCKIYGTIYLNNVSGTGNMTITITGTGIDVDSPITINNHGFMSSTIYQLNQVVMRSLLFPLLLAMIRSPLPFHAIAKLVKGSFSFPIHYCSSKILVMFLNHLNHNMV